MAQREQAESLRNFIASAKTRGVDDATIAAILRHQGWSERRINAAFTAYYQENLGIPIPARGGRAESAREAFFYLLSFVLLGIWTVALVWLGDVLIDRALPSQLNAESYDFVRRAISGHLAALIVAFPIYLWVNRLLARELTNRPESLESGVRKWLTYIALVVAAGTLVGDAIWFLTTFLAGDLSSRFVMKALLLLVVAGGVFWYYLGTIRADASPGTYNRIFGTVASLGVAVAIGLGFVAIGSPSHERAVTADEARVNAIFSLAQDVNSRSGHGKPLPTSLDQLTRSSDGRDPVTGRYYEYVPLAGGKYRLCANFQTDTRNNDPGSFWAHSAGRHCFELNAADLPPAP